MPEWTMPRGPHRPAWQALRGSAFLSIAMTLCKGQHAYVDGGQQYGRRAAPLVAPSKHDSSVFVLQSARAPVRAL